MEGSGVSVAAATAPAGNQMKSAKTKAPNVRMTDFHDADCEL
jgi:hypothetical protein